MLFEKCQWAAAYEDGRAAALCLLFKGLTPNAVFCMGKSAGLALVLGSVMRPGRVFFAALPEHMADPAGLLRPGPAGDPDPHGADRRRPSATWRAMRCGSRRRMSTI